MAINWLILKINKNESRSLEWSSIFIDLLWFYWYLLKTEMCFLFSFVVPSESCKPREMNPRKEPRIRPERIKNGNRNYCSPGCLWFFNLFYRLFYFSVYSTYAEISTWCGQSGLTRSAWRWPSWSLSLQALNASPCSPLFLETENTSPSFTLKGQWWYTLTTQEIEISTVMTASVFANQRLSKCLP